MFKPGGFLKKVFGNPIKAVHKAVKGTHKMVGKVAGKATGGLTNRLPGSGSKKPKSSPTPAPAATNSPRINPIAGGGASVGGGSAIGRRSGGIAKPSGNRFGGMRKMY